MRNLTVFLLGLALTPACLSVRPKDKQCFSRSLKPNYPCCKEDNIIYTDRDGDWGLENGRWCGIGDGYSKESCFSVDLGYPCCKSCDVKYSDESGKWGIENKKWCGIKDTCTSVIEEPVQNATAVSNTEFDFAFLKMENNKENMLYSPLSIEYALNMLQEGAATDTYNEINKIIGNSKLSKYSSIDKNLSLANGLFISKTYFDLVKKEYINALKEKYDAEIKEDEFKDAKNANKWIEEKTLGIIKDMLKDENVKDPDLIMLIINALAIDMEWADQFICNDSHGGTFYLDDGKEMEATMMFQKEVRSEAIAYYKDDDLTVLSMDLKEYNGTQFEFMALMPNKNLSGFVENVSKEQISEIDKNLKLSSDEKDGVNIRIPKFKFSYDLKLKKDLIQLGIEHAFDKRDADFSKMVDSEKLKQMDKNAYVSDALHKADIEFTEKGVKAAAVTVFVMMAATSVQIERHPISIEINKPFMFVIRDKDTKDVWFTGTVYKPNLWEDEKDSYKTKYNY